MPSTPLYPLSFTPIFRPVLWGGTRLMRYKGYADTSERIGECWEISPIEEHLSVVDKGSLQGKTLKELMQAYGRDILGTKHFARYGERFPLLIKLINAEQDLSVQVHPDKVSPKSEMWYILETSGDARISAGFRQGVTSEKYLSAVQEHCVPQLLHYDAIEAGNLFYIPAGRIHTIGAGSFLLEVQQPSDTTYRIFDYQRRDQEGHLRPLHLEQALEVLDFTAFPPYKERYTERKNRLNRLLSTPYFLFSTLHIDKPYMFTASEAEGCAVFFVAHGAVEIEDRWGQKVLVEQGHSVLIPSVLIPLTLTPSAASKILVVTLPE